MEMQQVIRQLETISHRNRSSLPEPLRPFYGANPVNSRGALITGARGVGKTTFLLFSMSDDMIYISADNPLLAGIPLWDVGEAAFMSGFQGIVVDEVHFAKDWSRDLKALYDSYPRHKIWASDSSSLVLREGVADLSRRFPITRVPLLSLREFAVLKGEKDPGVIDPLSPDNGKIHEYLDETNVTGLFREYLEGGFRPFFTEGRYMDRLENVIGKMQFSDIPFFVPQITDNHLRLMKAATGYLARSDVPVLNVERLCKEWGLGKAKLLQLFEVMETVGLIRIARKENDNRVYSKGAKLFLGEPPMYSLFGGGLGVSREAFAVLAFQESGREIESVCDERRGDFVVEGELIEIGGRLKKIKNADIVFRDDTELPGKGGYPLWLLGMGW
jgi:hypothetical protein